MELPIDDVQGEFLGAIEGDGPTVVVAPTGSGKSTRLPIWMERALEGPILVVEPRRVACRSLAEFLAEQRGEEPGETIGYRVRFDDRTSEKTRVIFATTGVALRMLGADEEWPFAGVVVDEFHERGWEVDLIVAILRARDDDPEFGPFVLTSATIEAGRLARELGADLVRSEGRTHPVEIEYAGEPKAPTGRDLEGRVRDAVEQVVEEESDGDILVFLPGKGEISDCKRALGGVASEHGLELLEVHGRLPPSQMARAFETDHAERRVYLATNVAETSVTLPGVTTVLDSGLVKMRIHRGGRSALALVATSEASMDQRAGRAGRVQPGRCIRLFSRRFRPEATTPPEIERIELDEVLLHAACSGLDGEAFDRAPWLSEPPEFAVEEARERLRGVGAFDDDNTLTELGRRLAELPVDAHDARMLIDPPAELKGTLCDLVALLQRSTDLLLPMSMIRSSRRDEVKRNRNELLAEYDDEVHVELASLRWGYPREHGLHRSAWEEAKKVSASLREIVGAPVDHPRSDEEPLPESRELSAFLLERIPEYGFVLRERAKRRRRDGKPKMGRSEPWANGEVELDVYPFEPPVDSRARDREVEHPEAGLVLDVFWIGGEGTGVHGIGSMLLPATKAQLAEAGLGETVPTSLRIEKGGMAPRVVATVEREFAGTTLRGEERELEGRPLCEAVAQAICEGRLFKGVAAVVREDLHLLEVLGDWPERERYWSGVDDVPELEEYLERRLWELGLRASEDLALIENEDLRPDLSEALGLPDFEIEKWREKFPHTWEHMGAEYVCKVQPSVEKVILEPINKKAKKGDDPVARHLPRFEGFSVYYRNASRVVPVRE